MRFLAMGVAGLVLVGVPTLAVGESGEQLQARGEQLAKDGRYTEAIDAFKAAEKAEPRARHSCFIALAYTRREAWAQAEIFLDACHERASTSDPLPEWVPMVDQLLAERLALAAPIEIHVEPAGTDVKLAVSSFAPDELFEPRTIHLAPGRHVILATAKGFNDAQKTIEVTDKAPQTVMITLLPIGDAMPEGGGAVGGGTVVRRTAGSTSNVPMYLTIGGGAVVVAGALVHATLFRTARQKLVDANELAKTMPDTGAREYAEWSSQFDTRRTLTIALYGVGAAAVLTGVILRYTVFNGSEHAPQVAVEPHVDGGLVTLGWSR